jgi:uncharacterized RDD family membrane protein YckC
MSDANSGSPADNRYAVSPATAYSTERANTGAMPYAGFWRRAGGYLIDYILVTVVLKLITAALLGGHPSGALSRLYVVIGAAAACLYYALLESSDWQATLGKKAVGIKVTDLNGEQISFGRALGRVFAHIPSSLILGIGFLMAAFTERRQALHDKIAGTLVVLREESPEDIAAAGPAPPASAGSIVVIVLVFLIFPVGGIVAAIAIPAYQAYTIRAQIAEGLTVAGPFESAIASAVDSGKPLNSISSTTLDVSLPDTAKYVESVQVVRGAVDIHYGRSANKLITGGHLVLVPGTNAGTQLTWYCGHVRPPAGVTLAIDDFQKFTNIPDRLLPATCRP